jgi:hypothetical protein
MSKNARTIIAALFVLAFLVSAPLVVLSTKGYRYDWRKTKLEKTGILRIESVPSGADVVLNGAPTHATTPTAFTRLLPEQYDVRLDRPDMLPWQKTLAVRSGETTFATGIRLVSAALPTLQSRLIADRAVFDANGGRAVFFRENGEWTEVGIAATDGASETLLARFSRSDAADPHAEWSPEGDAVALAVTRGGTRRVTVYDADPPHSATAVTDSEIRWGGGVAASADEDAPIREADGRVLVKDAARGTLTLIDTATGANVATYGATRFALPPGERGWDGLVLWSDFEILSVDAETGERTTVTRIGTPITDVRPLPDRRLIAYSTGSGITLIEREDIGGRAVYELVHSADVRGMGINPDGERLFFLGTIGSQRGIYARDL